MKNEFVLKIDTDERKYNDIFKVLRLNPSSIINYWEYELKNSNPIAELYAILNDKIILLNELGILREHFTLWLYYEYENQCNMEFSSKDLMMLSELGIQLCISCWEKGANVEI